MTPPFPWSLLIAGPATHFFLSFDNFSSIVFADLLFRATFLRTSVLGSSASFLSSHIGVSGLIAFSILLRILASSFSLLAFVFSVAFKFFLLTLSASFVTFLASFLACFTASRTSLLSSFSRVARVSSGVLIFNATNLRTPSSGFFASSTRELPRVLGSEARFLSLSVSSRFLSSLRFIAFSSFSFSLRDFSLTGASIGTSLTASPSIRAGGNSSAIVLSAYSRVIPSPVLSSGILASVAAREIAPTSSTPVSRLPFFGAFPLSPVAYSSATCWIVLAT